MMIGLLDTQTEDNVFELLPICDSDMPFLYDVFVSTKQAMFTEIGLSEAAVDELLTMQFDLQNRSYTERFPNACFYKIVVKGRDAGRLVVDRAEEETRIIDIALLEEYRNQGIGSMMIGSVVEESIKRSRPTTLHVERSSQAVRLYLRLGFEQISETDTHLFLRRTSR